MPDGASPAQAVLEALGYAIFARTENGGLRSLGKIPPWLAALWPAIQKNDDCLPLGEASPFLENFLIDAEECWRKGADQQIKSGPWVERDASGAAVELEATALTTNEQALLILERLGEAFAAKKEVLQRARETLIAQQRLNSEIQKKEILLHCVADEMSAALANVITSLRLIEQEDSGPRTRALLGLATRATQEQQTLIHRILEVFEGELRGVHDSAGDRSVAGWSKALRQAIESVAPLFEEKGVKVDTSAATVAVRVTVDPIQLERVCLNLFENALERSRSGDTVVVRAEESAETLLVSFEDQGAFVTPEMRENFFAQWSSPNDASSASALRLHFCRIVMENCGGEIDFDSLPAGGNRFWIRLTKSTGA
ncbi:MAG TPA: HAMP domain-containing sensor histidine kinase [Chthoniobacterales bacterium]|jgi:hypothetical protein